MFGRFPFDLKIWGLRTLGAQWTGTLHGGGAAAGEAPGPANASGGLCLAGGCHHWGGLAAWRRVGSWCAQGHSKDLGERITFGRGLSVAECG